MSIPYILTAIILSCLSSLLLYSVNIVFDLRETIRDGCLCRRFNLDTNGQRLFQRSIIFDLLLPSLFLFPTIFILLNPLIPYL